MTIITRFAPSPTGMLHIGNARTALINWLYARKYNGKFILRIDDTDLERSKEEYVDAIIKDLSWLGLNWDIQFAQSSRLVKYEEAKNTLIKAGRLYPCYETQEELEIKRKLQLAAHKPPLYDRAALVLTEKQKEEYIAQGRKPHYRFLMNDDTISWNDMVKGDVRYEGQHIGDPILIRENGSMTYMICSTVDDIDYNISHILRGEDHVTNTAVQYQMFKALGAIPPVFGHLSLVKTRDEKISKRVGGFDIASLRKNTHLEPMAINSFLSTIGTSLPVIPKQDLSDVLTSFDISAFSKSPTTYMPDELDRINEKLLHSFEYHQIKHRLGELNISHIDHSFWNAIRPNLKKLPEIQDWWNICYNHMVVTGLDKEYLQIAATLLPNAEFSEHTWSEWTKLIAENTGRSGKNLFLPLRLAITGMENGPELKYLLPIIGKKEVLSRLTSN